MEKHFDEKSTALGDTTPPSYKQVATHSTAIKPQARLLHDPDVTFEEYHYYALRTRQEELTLESPKLNWREIVLRKKNASDVNGSNDPNHDHKDHMEIDMSHRAQITDEEWTNASRAFRTASWGACFYLITTDILGPYGVGFALGTLGWGPGIALYTVFGAMAGYSGYLICHVFLGLDSYEFPCRNYGDLGFRTWGTAARYVTNILQALALLLILGQVTIQYGQNISQVSKFKLCYAICPLLFVCVGFFLTQIRTLKAYGWLANFSVWLTLLTIFISMGVIANSPPNFAISPLGSAGSAVAPDSIKPFANGTFPAVTHFTALPPNGLVGSINGLLSGVLAYAGAQLFVEFLAEMRRPRDFYKAMWGAQLFIFVVYLSYGSFVYFFQGQYAYQNAYQGVSIYGWQTVGNMLSLLAALIAAGLYGNIGIKVLYNNILMDIFSAPPLITKRGKIIYACIVPIWWAIAFIIAGSIPDYFGFVSIISASCLLNMTYTLPPLFALGYDIQKNAMRDGDGFDPVTGQARRQGTTLQRYARGFVSGTWWEVARNVWHVIYFFASLSMCGLGMFAAVQGLITQFKAHQLNAWTCVSPLHLNAQQ